jgi:CheY-like chemotaxis protein
MIDELLDFARIQTGAFRSRKKLVQSFVLADECIARLSLLAEKKDVTIKNLIPRGLWVFADPNFLDRCVDNLLTNSIKFSLRGGCVEVIAKDGDANVIGVKDNGVGIDPDVVSHLFKFDVKTSSVGTGGEIGTGFGLPLCHDMMCSQNGSISVETALGKGTTFYLLFPQNDLKVLVVDNNPEEIMAISQLLSPLKVKVLSAGNGRDALESVKTSRPNLVITGLFLKDMDCIELIQELRNNPSYKDIPVMAVTGVSDRQDGNSSEELKMRLVNLGVDDFISKTEMTDDLTLRASKILSD